MNYKYKAVIFDLDDTIVESRIAKWNQHKYVAKNFYNIDLTDDILKEHWGKPFDLFISILYKHSDTIDNMRNACASTTKMFPKKLYKGSLNVVNELLGNGVKVGVLSATTISFLKKDLEFFNFPISRFSFIQGADDTLYHKPDSKVFEPLLNYFAKQGIKNNDIVYIGDSVNDFKAADGAGINFIGVTTGLHSKKDFKNEGAKVVVNSITEVINVL